MIQLPVPRTCGPFSLEQALASRRSIREYLRRPLALKDISQLLWSAYGISNDQGLRTAPSALTLYPLELHLAAGEVTGLPPGLYRFLPAGQTLELEQEGDVRQELYATTYQQESVRHGAIVVVFAAVYSRAQEKFGEDARDYVHMDLGHSAENLHLQATALGLGTVVIAAFRRIEAARVLNLPEPQTPLYLMPVGYPQK